uniref:aspartate transaminase n=1 Tax=Oncorhynchus mykiss TaxID=8022 RepID=A0A8C7P7J5_ONCMY
MTLLSIFVDTPTAEPNPETKLLADFKTDTHLRKVYLAGREYLNKEGQTSVSPLIGKIMQQICTDPTLCPEYPSSFGLPEFTRRATELVLGRDCHAIVENRVLGVQTVGCTGAVRLGAELLKHWYNVSGVWCGPVYLSSPCDGKNTCYSSPLQSPHALSILLSASFFLHSQRCRFFPFFLLPAQGLCHGDFQQDAWPVRLCASLGMELLCAQSFSHSFGLYGERVGHLLCVLKQSSTLLAVQSQAEKQVRALWSRPSVRGARVVATVLSNPAHHVEWQEGVKSMVERGILVRERLREKLRLLGCPGSWDHLIQQGGLYCCTGLNVQQVEFLEKRRHIYLHPNGCLNVSAINSCNLDYIAESIHLALTSVF